MARAKPSLALAEMESKLGYRVDSLTYPCENVKRFYSNLRPIPVSSYERTKEEFEVYEKKLYGKGHSVISEGVLPQLNVVLTIAHGADTITLTRRSHVVFYSVTIDIHCGFGFDLSLLVTTDEALRTLSVAKLQSNTTYSATSMLYRLPRELRHKIYVFALPRGKWKIEDGSIFNELNFTGGMGDPSGFYFPLSKDLAILRVDRQMRQEALPLAYRRTVFQLDDMDDLIKLLIAVGNVGRENIESLELAWDSRTDSECKWEEAPDSEELYLKLPTLHVVKCVQLLNQCKRLASLRLYFERDLILNIPSDVYESDPGIHGLRSIRGIRNVEFWGLDHEPLQQYGLVKYLKEEMESPRGGRKDEKEIRKQD